MGSHDDQYDDTDNQYEESESTGGRPNKSALKRLNQQLQGLAKQATALPADRIRKLELPERLESALLEYQRIKSHQALSRQLSFLTRLLRENADESLIARLNSAVEKSTGHGKLEAALFKRAEQLRNRLLEDSGLAGHVFETYPDLDTPEFHQVLERAVLEAQGVVSKKGAARQLFKLIHQALSR